MAESAAPAGVQVHPLGLCESDDVGPGTRVWAWAHVLPGARIGAECNICDHAFVEGGARIGDRVTVKNAVLVFDGVAIGDDVFLGPNVLFTNDLRPRAHRKRGPEALLPTVVEDGVTLGAGTVVVCGTRIGRHAFAAAGSVITRHVAPHSFVAGNPATHRGWVCECGERLPRSLRCSCGRAYRTGSAAPTGPQPGDADVGPGGLAERAEMTTDA
jgi:UDP-2-acetamido-3-amino-2,3-dideoxy-glucuronate N-acetyltransferase